MAKITTPDSLYGNSRDILREAERENEILADIAGEEYESPGDIPKGKYVIEKRLLDAAQKKNELLESIAGGGGGGGGGAAKAIGIDYATDVISLKNKDGETIAGSGATLPAYGVSFDPATGGLTLTKNGTAVSGQTVTIPNYGSPVGVTSSSDMTDEGTIYLYEGTTGGGFTNGHFYYYDGSAWADGGEYAAATVQTDKTLLVEDRAADAKATGEAVGELKTQLKENYQTLTGNFTVMANNIHSSTRDRISVDIAQGDKFSIVYKRNRTNIIQFFAYDENDNGTEIGSSQEKSGTINITAQSNIKKIGTTTTAIDTDETYYIMIALGNTPWYNVADIIPKLNSDIESTNINKNRIANLQADNAINVNYVPIDHSTIYRERVVKNLLFKKGNSYKLDFSLNVASASTFYMDVYTYTGDIRKQQFVINRGLGIVENNIYSYYYIADTDFEGYIAITTPSHFTDTVYVRVECINTSLKDLVFNGYCKNLYIEYLTEEGYIANDGTVVREANDRTTHYIDIENAKNISFQLWAKYNEGDRTNWVAYCLYDNEKTLIGTRAVISTGGTGEYIYYTIPNLNGAKYIRLSCRVRDGYKIMINEGAYPIDYYEAVEDINHKINVNSGRLSPLEIERIYNISTSHAVKGVNHRGWSDAPENTIIAFKESRNHGFAYVETDVRFTSDGVAVLLHDETINRTARNSDGTQLEETINIANITYEQALAYDFGIYKNAKYAGTRIPTLREFLAFCKNTGLKAYIELKANPVSTVYNIVKEYAFEKDCTFIGGYNALNTIKELDASARLGVVSNEGTQAIVDLTARLKTNTNEVFLDDYVFTDALVEMCKTAEIGLEIWTINSTATIINMNPYISGVTSDNKNASIVLYDNAMM